MTVACVSWDDPAFRASPEPTTDAVSPAVENAGAPDDDELLRRIGENDELAFRTLVERHVDRAFALALRILDNRADADDVVQDSLLKVWTHRHRWECGRAKFSTWLYRVVTNRCIDLRRRPRNEDVEAVGEVADGAPDAVTAMHRSEVSELLDAAMNRLPDQQRIAIILSYHEAMSNAEIADVMDTTVAAVESLLKRARQQLRKLLRRSEPDIRQALTDD
ncbi:RNA polymerase sigma factor [Rhodoplanes sp. SY1]|uniref:RNA polymerase sigma factor n=1 Tax=Rhodoplanes sp. SY1 TaxID=3166646 RepID=UPI0038B5AD95